MNTAIDIDNAVTNGHPIGIIVRSLLYFCGVKFLPMHLSAIGSW